MEMAAYSFPINPRFPDTPFGREAQQYIDEFDNNCDVRGTNFDRRAASRLRLMSEMTDGDIGIHLTQDKEGRPKIQHIRAHRIHNGNLQNGPLSKTRHLSNGVITDEVGKPVAYLVQQGSDRNTVRRISANNMILRFNPLYSDQSRGISVLGSAITTFADIKQVREWNMYAFKMASAMVFKKKVLGGLPEEGDGFIMSDAGTDVTGLASGNQIQAFERGMTMYLDSADPNADLEQVEFDRPSSEAQAFEDRMMRMSLYGIGWDPDFALSLKSPNGAWARTIIEKIRRSIQSHQEREIKTLRRIHAYALSKAIKLKLVREPDQARFWDSWEYEVPARLTADSGNERNATLSEYQAGTRSLQTIAGEQGRHWVKLREQREFEVSDLLQRAKRIADANGIELKDALQLMEGKSPNPDFDLGSEGQETETIDGEAEESGNSEKDGFETLKAKFDAYGVAVRAGAITPATEDEEQFRKEAGLPSMSESVKTAWKEDEGFRRPITLVQKIKNSISPQSQENEES